MNKTMSKEKQIIPLIFVVDDNYAPFLSVTLKSILENASKNYFYKIYVLNTGLNETNRARLSVYNTENSSLEYVNVEKQMSKLNGKLYLRDYYTQTTYYRFFIPTLFPQYDKVLYLDCDLIATGDISELYNVDLKDNYVAAIQEEIMALVKVFGDYVEEGLGIKKENYFNAGVLVLNLNKLREIKLEDRFIELLSRFKFEVTQDQDYLNVICKGNVKFLDLGWNKSAVENPDFNDKNLKLIHYKLYYKPWFYQKIKYDSYFWRYAAKTEYADEIKDIFGKCNHKKLVRDLLAYKNLMKMARAYLSDDNCYYKLQKSNA